jgi:hypothetical protein
MNADNKRFIKHFVIKQLWDESYSEELRRDLGTYAMIRGIDELEAMKEYEYQVERIQKMLACY